MEHTVVWFAIPVCNLDRAMQFYRKVLGLELQTVTDSPQRTAFFPFAPGVVSGALVEEKDYVSNGRGTTVYLNGGADLATPLARVDAAGGKILQAKTAIGAHGYIAYFQDTEGNRLGIHSPA